MTDVDVSQTEHLNKKFKLISFQLYRCIFYSYLETYRDNPLPVIGSMDIGICSGVDSQYE